MKFTEITGKERYKVIDMATGGQRLDATKPEMYASVYYFKNVLDHPVSVHDRADDSVTIYR